MRARSGLYRGKSFWFRNKLGSQEERRKGPRAGGLGGGGRDPFGKTVGLAADR